MGWWTQGPSQPRLTPGVLGTLGALRVTCCRGQVRPPGRRGESHLSLHCPPSLLALGPLAPQKCLKETGDKRLLVFAGPPRGLPWAQGLGLGVPPHACVALNLGLPGQS